MFLRPPFLLASILCLATFTQAMPKGCATSTSGSIGLRTDAPVSHTSKRGFNQAVYDGCTVFAATGDPSNDPYNAPITNETPDPTSSAVLASVSGGGPLRFAVGTEGTEYYDPINIATKETNVATIVGHNDFGLTHTSRIPWDFSKFGHSNLNDRLSFTLDPHTCGLWEIAGTDPVAGANVVGTDEGGYFFDLRKPYAKSYPGAYEDPATTTASASGLSIFAGSVKWNGELGANPPVLNHALTFGYPTGGSCEAGDCSAKCVSQAGYVFPATGPTGEANMAIGCTGLLRYGDHFRLKSSVPCPSEPQAAAVCSAMKTYGIIYRDQGSNFYIMGLAPDGTTDAPYDPAIGEWAAGITLTNDYFDLMPTGPVHCQSRFAGAVC